MNALDLLVDFAALVSIPDASKTQMVSKKEDGSPNSVRSATLSASTLVGSPFMHNSVTELPIDRAQCYFPMAQLSSQQAAGQLPASRPLPSEFYNSYIPVQQIRQPPQSFDQHLQQNPGLGLPYEVACGTHAPCDCEYFPSWTPGYEAVPQPWNAYQPFYGTRQPDMRFGLLPGGASTGGFECRDELCGCQYAIPQTFHTMDGARMLWKMEEPPHPNGYNEWAVPDKQFRTR
jgi:hypothetical protein